MEWRAGPRAPRGSWVSRGADWAVGGAMSLTRSVLTAQERELVSATLLSYARGWFPMYDPDTNVVNWVQPRWRGVIPMDARFRVSRSLRAAVRSGKFEITSDR